MSQDDVNADGTFQAAVIKVAGPSTLRVNDFVKNPPSTPGNVGICLSGGGSRAMTAGMGQLRALKLLTKGSNNLLAQTKAIATVSGGSWVGTTFQYINNAAVSDDDYLGQYITPSKLVKDNFQNLSEKNIGFRCTSHFSILDLFWEAVRLIWNKVPPNMVWQMMIGNHIMKYYNVFSVDSGNNPNTYFTYDGDTQAAIVKQNPALASEKGYLIAAGNGRVPRPYLACNMGMLVNKSGTTFEYLVPVQATPYFTGVIGTPAGVTDKNGRAVGGGGVTSFAFSSNLTAIAENTTGVAVTQNRQFALVDAVGTSSAAFAEALRNFATKYEDNMHLFIQDMIDHHENLKLQSQQDQPEHPKGFHDFLGKLKGIDWKDKALHVVGKLDTELEKVGIDLDKDLQGILDKIKELVPQYKYWPVKQMAVNTNVKPTNFADAGSLENTAVTAMLAYADIDNIIAFVNAMTPIKASAKGALDANGKEIAGTNVSVDDQLPPLFGYQPYDEKVGYKLYKGDAKPSSPIYQYNQVFDSSYFVELLQGFKKNSGSGSTSIDNFGANYLQKLVTLQNDWFGVAANRSVKVLWVYNGNFAAWNKALSTDMQHLVSDIKNFPFYNTFFQLELKPSEVNALAHLTSWNIAENIKDTILGLYQ